MELRQLGRSSLRVAPIVFGGTVLGWTVDQAAAFRILDAFVDAGFNAIDTADTYSRFGPGNKERSEDSETIIGNWLRLGGGRRERVLIFTKVGRETAPGRKGLSRRHIESSIEDSLRRLRVDTIDLYQSHRDDGETPIIETLEAYGDLIKKGKIRAIGASNFTVSRFGEALGISLKNDLPRYEALQPRFNLYDREYYPGELEHLCVAENVGVISYFALAGGFLTGKYRSASDIGVSPRGSRMPRYLNPRGVQILSKLDKVSKIHGVNPAAVALAWLIARPSITATIASVTTLEQLKEFTHAVQLKLSSAEISLLDSL